MSSESGFLETFGIGEVVHKKDNTFSRCRLTTGRIIASTHLIGYSLVPTVLRVGGFRVVIFLPPREHEPPQVHVWSADGEAVIDLATAVHPQSVRSVWRMRTNDVATAFWIVEEHMDYLLERWREHHG